MSTQRPFDLVLFGATGFTGGLTAEYLAAHAPAEARLALAGRNRAKLEAVRDRLVEINTAMAEVALLHADKSGEAKPQGDALQRRWQVLYPRLRVRTVTVLDGAPSAAHARLLRGPLQAASRAVLEAAPREPRAAPLLLQRMPQWAAATRSMRCLGRSCARSLTPS